MKPFKCVIFSESDLETEVFSFSTAEELQAFSAGVDAGSDCYGAGRCFTIAPNQIDDMEQDKKITPRIAEQARRMMT